MTRQQVKRIGWASILLLGQVAAQVGFGAAAAPVALATAPQVAGTSGGNPAFEGYLGASAAVQDELPAAGGGWRWRWFAALSGWRAHDPDGDAPSTGSDTGRLSATAGASGRWRKALGLAGILSGGFELYGQGTWATAPAGGDPQESAEPDPSAAGSLAEQPGFGLYAGAYFSGSAGNLQGSASARVVRLPLDPLPVAGSLESADPLRLWSLLNPAGAAPEPAGALAGGFLVDFRQRRSRFLELNGSLDGWFEPSAFASTTASAATPASAASSAASSPSRLLVGAGARHSLWAPHGLKWMAGLEWRPGAPAAVLPVLRLGYDRRSFLRPLLGLITDLEAWAELAYGPGSSPSPSSPVGTAPSWETSAGLTLQGGRAAPRWKFYLLGAGVATGGDGVSGGGSVPPSRALSVGAGLLVLL